MVMGDINIDTFKDSMDYDFSAIMKSILYDNKEKWVQSLIQLKKKFH